MKDYSNFKAEDFARDEWFMKWVKYPDRYQELDSFWKSWLKENPHKKEDIEEAQYLILSFTAEGNFPSDQRQNEVWNKIQQTLEHDNNNKVRDINWWRPVLTKAAVILISVGLGWIAFEYSNHSSKETNIAIENTDKIKTEINKGDLTRTILLPDGTSIVLQPGARLQYVSSFKGNLREVFLNGEAFFEVKKDSARPFIVHANKILTRVVGTSFTIRNNENENILVQVKTGKVTVQEINNNKQKGDTEVVLLPNQQIEYEYKKEEMVKSLVKAKDLKVPVARLDFQFTDTPVSQVFDIISDAYKIDIIYDKELLKNCRLNASLSDVPLNDKIKLICKAIQTTYKMNDAEIIISGRGCSGQ